MKSTSTSTQSVVVPSGLSIKEASVALKCEQNYVRKLLREGKLTSNLVPTKPGSSVMKHLISKASIEARLTRQGDRTKREDGRNRWLIWATPSEMLALQSLLKDAGMELPHEMPNKGMYAKRKAGAAE
jgi:hypothetical protein